MTVFGNQVITRCPICRKLIEQRIGATQYFDYKNKLVRITNHCNKDFITTDAEVEPFPQHRYFVSDDTKPLIEEITTLCIDNEATIADMNEDDAVNYILNLVQNNANPSDLKLITQVMLSRLRIDVYTEILSDDIRKQLKPSITCLY
jgi:hypothetical protein